MQLKISIKCEGCSCKFELQAPQFRDRTSLECPNCGREFPKDIFSCLKTGIIALSSVPETVPETSAMYPFDDSERPEFRLQIGDFDILN